MSGNRWNRVPHEFWRNRLARPRLDDLALVSGKNRLFLIVNLNEERTVTILQAGEKRSQPVIIVLGPTLAGMIMAAGTLQADAEKKLSDLLASPQRSAQPGI